METEKNQPDILFMKLHERIHLKKSRDLNIFVTKVPGGWIYEYSEWMGVGLDGIHSYSTKQTQFVPMVQNS